MHANCYTCVECVWGVRGHQDSLLGVNLEVDMRMAFMAVWIEEKQPYGKGEGKSKIKVQVTLAEELDRVSFYCAGSQASRNHSRNPTGRKSTMSLRFGLPKV